MTIVAIGVVVGVAAAMAETSPSKVTAATTQLNWNGVQGVPVDQKCGDNADPGAGGYQNGAAADNYMLWIFTTDGGDVSAPPTLTINGTTYDTVHATGQWQIVTPYFAPATITDAHTNFTVADPGSGSWVLTISHGCDGGGNTPPAADLTVTKDATGSFDRSYAWHATKNVDKTSANLTQGQSVTFTYTVGVSHDPAVDSNWQVNGSITVTNPNPTDAVTGVTITDAIDNGGVCTVTNGTNVSVPPNGFVTRGYTCTYAAKPSPDAATNTATAAWPAQDLPTDGHLAANSATGTASVDFSTVTPNTTDECTTLVDDNATPGNTADDISHHYCVGDAGDPSFSFTYTRTVSYSEALVGRCVSYTNTAVSTTDDTKTTSSAGKTVTVCFYHAALTIGYWKTHMRVCGAREKTGTDGCNSNGPFTSSFLGNSICNGCATVGKLGTYSANTGALALAVFNANNCSSTTDAGAAACLAAQLLAAELNVANIANPCICDTIKAANALLAAIGYAGPASTVHFGAAGSGNTRADAVALKTALDNYNNGGGCQTP